MKVNLKIDLDKRQKIILVLIILSLIILFWQLQGIFSDNQQPNGAAQNKNLPMKSQLASPIAAPMQTGVIKPVVNTAEADAVQQKYLALVNEYQLVEIQKMIAQDEASIAQSRAQTAESMAKVAQISGQAPNFGMEDRISTSRGNDDYELIYTGEDNHQWTATLKKQGQFNDVTAGSELPDGGKVLSVDDNGVTLSEGGVKKLITFNGVTILSHEESNSPAKEELPSLQVKPVQKVAASQKKIPELPVPQNLAKK